MYHRAAVMAKFIFSQAFPTVYHFRKQVTWKSPSKCFQREMLLYLAVNKTQLEESHTGRKALHTQFIS